MAVILPMGPNTQVKAPRAPVVERILQPQRPHGGVDAHANAVAIPRPRFASHASRVSQHAGAAVQVASIVTKHRALDQQ